MGGYRLEPTDTGLWVRDLSTDEPLELLDLGAGSHADEDGWLVGRLVPSGTTPSLMFDTRPLPVDEQTAREVAAGTTPGAWVTALVSASTEGRFDREVLMSEDRELPTDVPSLELLRAGTPPRDYERTLQQLWDGRDEIGRAAFRILRSAAEGACGDDWAPYVGAAVLNVHGFAEAQRHLVGGGRDQVWSHWAELVPDPAAGRLRRLAASDGFA